MTATSTPAPSSPALPRIQAVVIGASAGGIDAISTLLESLPEEFDAALMVVIHMPSDGSGTLPSLFACHCKLPVKEAEDKETIAAGCVYIAPPDYHLLVEPGKTMALSGDAPVNYSRPSIDVLLESAALVYREHLLGIILTGANNDGAAGLKAIRACGGRAWVQAPDDAVADAMPSAAIAQAGADLILPLAELAERLRCMPGANGFIRRS